MKSKHWIAWLALTATAWAQEPVIDTALRTNDQLQVSWTNGLPPFQVVQLDGFSTNGGTVVLGPTTNRSARIPAAGTSGAFRIDALGQPPAAFAAQYRITFSNLWTAENHPDRYPGNAHYSRFIGAVHNADASFWAPGQPATTGIKNMAEFGANAVLSAEIQAGIDAGHALAEIALGTFDINQDFPLVSMVSMVAPSPDWFIGVHDLPLFDGGQWTDDLTIQLFPYDAGTDSGTTYTAPNQATVPPQPIARITGAPFLNGAELRPLGTFRFERIDPPAAN